MSRLDSRLTLLIHDWPPAVDGQKMNHRFSGDDSGREGRRIGIRKWEERRVSLVSSLVLVQVDFQILR